jgi:hypothetical protein
MSCPCIYDFPKRTPQYKCPFTLILSKKRVYTEGSFFSDEKYLHKRFLIFLNYFSLNFAPKAADIVLVALIDHDRKDGIFWNQN